MPDVKFWRTYPRTLKALLDVHVEVQGGKSKRKQPQEAYIDQVLF